MKRIAIITVLMIALSLFLFATCSIAQGVRKEGNTYIATKVIYDTATTYTYRDVNGKEYPMFVSKNGKYYIWRVSKKGTKYKYYLKLN